MDRYVIDHEASGPGHTVFRDTAPEVLQDGPFRPGERVRLNAQGREGATKDPEGVYVYEVERCVRHASDPIQVYVRDFGPYPFPADSLEATTLPVNLPAVE